MLGAVVRTDDAERSLALADEALARFDVDGAVAHLSAAIRGFTAADERCRAAMACGVPSAPPEDADVEALVAFPFAEALPASVRPEDLGDWDYAGGHQAAIRMMLVGLKVEG